MKGNLKNKISLTISLLILVPANPSLAQINLSLSPNIFLSSQNNQKNSHIQPPVAAKKPHQEVRHGEKVEDNYFWLRQKDNPEVINYLKAENAYTAKMTANLKSLQQQLYKEMSGRIQQEYTGVVTKQGNYYYYIRYEKNKDYAIHCRKKADKYGKFSPRIAEEIILNENELAKNQKYLDVNVFNVSNDNNLLAFTTDNKGDIRYTLKIKDLRTGKLLPLAVENVSSVIWANNKTVFYTTQDPVTNRANTLWRLEIGGKTQKILEEKDVEFFASVYTTKNNRYILFSSRSKDTSEISYLDTKNLDKNFQVLYPRTKGHEYSVEYRDNLWYVITNKGINGNKAVNNRIVTVPVNNPEETNWQEFLPHRQDALIEGVDLYQEFLVASEKILGLNRFRIYNFKTKNWREVSFPESTYTAELGESNNPDIDPEFTATSFRYTYTSLTAPKTIYEQDFATGKQKVIKKKIVPNYDASKYVSERVWVAARDGVRVPLSIVYRKGLQRNGKAPLLLYGYGAYGLEENASFDSNIISLLDRGVVYAIAHVRGGNELGNQWYEDGKLMKKKNTFNDFIDSAEYLTKQGWTSSDRLLIGGGSAGGLLIGAVVNMRPDLFKAAHLAVPFVDLMNTMWDDSLPLTTEEYLEWGNPNEKPAYDYMRSYSPYDNLAAKAYPSLLLTTSINDSQVGYWEPTKYVAKLRTLKTDQNPLLLKINLDAGHQGASGRYDTLKETAFEYAWMLQQVGLHN
ncbi:S9 family peptidase [Calothrix sp. PCC 6303]|uniref:S9 family peptidase n=1 Tax=Calothrix sp. PCC 6303 TaxID=1170562 RepID=UPI0002A01DF0|nr:S9 family peptidase [Calothrix sp. PCC 6303]AFY99789.1 Oligopeptidase B [Calothrix sp. PCC 6303]